MARLSLLTMSLLMVFIGFAMPFVFPGVAGFAMAGLILAPACILFWFVEKKTERSLQKNSLLNRILNTSDPDS